jgi:hypothetical protein
MQVCTVDFLSLWPYFSVSKVSQSYEIFLYFYTIIKDTRLLQCDVLLVHKPLFLIGTSVSSFW